MLSTVNNPEAAKGNGLLDRIGAFDHLPRKLKIVGYAHGSTPDQQHLDHAH